MSPGESCLLADSCDLAKHRGESCPPEKLEGIDTVNDRHFGCTGPTHAKDQDTLVLPLSEVRHRYS